MRKNKFIIMIMLSITLSLVMVLPTAIYAEEGIAEIDCTDAIECVETELFSGCENEDEDTSSLYGLTCPFCDRGSITRTVIDPTCSTYGSVEISCSNCGYYDYTTRDKIPHVYPNLNRTSCSSRVYCSYGCGSNVRGEDHNDVMVEGKGYRCMDCLRWK